MQQFQHFPIGIQSTGKLWLARRKLFRVIPVAFFQLFRVLIENLQHSREVLIGKAIQQIVICPCDAHTRSSPSPSCLSLSKARSQSTRTAPSERAMLPATSANDSPFKWRSTNTCRYGP